MAIYVLGDIQGCFGPLERLLEQLQFNPQQDQIWFAGDLVSRGHQSLETLRWVRQLSLQQAAITVLGNHDISLIAAAYQVIPPHKSLYSLLNAPDFAELIDWLRQQPLLHIDDTTRSVLVHAGIPPLWSLALAEACARHVERELRQPAPRAWLEQIFGNKPARWQHCYTPLEQQRFTVNALTRMRYCYADGKLEFEQKLNPNQVAETHPALYPWFRHPLFQVKDYRILFGHWSTLGYHCEGNTIALDTGCVWGGKLTAVRIDQPLEAIQIPCSDYERS